jgi:predicted metal-dependent hydrolase
MSQQGSGDVELRWQDVPGADHDGVTVEVVRSARRRRTISAHREGDRIVIRVPARMSRAEEAQWVERMVRRILDGERRQHRSDDELFDRARRLADRHLAGRARPAAVRWVDNQETLWGSCTPADRTIRLSRRLVGMPDYVIDYVLLHELAHLLVPGHGADFWALLEVYPRLERARGYLEGVAAASRLPGLAEPAA